MWAPPKNVGSGPVCHERRGAVQCVGAPGLWVRVTGSCAALAYRDCAESDVGRSLSGFGVLGEPADAVGLQDVM